MARVKPVPEFEETYTVSKAGCIRRVRGGRGSKPGRILSLHPHTNGYLTVLLSDRERRVRRFVRRLVALAFLGPPPTPDHVVNHRNGVKTDNRVENLEWASRSENNMHAFRAGLRGPTAQLIGEDSPHAKLTDACVRRIRALQREGRTYRDLAAQFGLGVTTVGRIVRRESWKHVSDHG